MHNKMGTLIVSIESHDLTAEDREILAHPLIGGVILFTRNYASRAQLKHLCETIRSSSKKPLLIMADQEGGRVQRFVNEFTRLPPMGLLGKLYDNNHEVASHLAKDCGWLMAMELLSVGIDLSLAPVLDLNKGISKVIGDRAFHSDSKIVLKLAQSFMIGMHEAGMASTGKHFPGHGGIAPDSHMVLPIDQRSLKEIEQEDMVPFAHLIKNNMTAMMAAHIIFSQIDELPVGFSSIWLKDILRKRLGFTGTIFSDDLNMEGANISANYVDRVIAAREAGCDFTLFCNNRQGVINVLDHLPHASHQVDKEKWGKLQGDFSRVQMPLSENHRWQKIHDFLLNLMQKTV